ncbi:MAG TPA: YidC/Oxa1 family membrane protein insertase [Patescibacteria group bacterium]|nr:YidC/Oxa1 family membrane protein insertase [Patescibacteria group bacterium]
MFDLFTIVFVNPITNLLVLFYKLMYMSHIPFAFGLSIILLTAAIRLILYPFTSAQIKSAAKMQKVTPHLAALKEKHKGDNKKLQEETMRLYKEHGVNPAAGCLPLVIQLPVIWALYHVLTIAVKAQSLKDLAPINKVLYFDFLKLSSVWDTRLWGLPIGSSPAKLLAVAPWIILIPVLTGVLQFVLSKMMMPEESLLPVTKTEEKKEDDFQAAFQKQSLFIFPAMIGFFSYSLPLGLSLYWNTFSVFGILQQYLLVGPGAAKHWFDKIKRS